MRELFEDFRSNGDSSCRPSTTIVDGNTVCAGALIFEDAFTGNSLDKNKWMVDHFIPVNSKVGVALNFEMVKISKKNFLELRIQFLSKQ